MAKTKRKKSASKGKAKAKKSKPAKRAKAAKPKKAKAAARRRPAKAARKPAQRAVRKKSAPAKPRNDGSLTPIGDESAGAVRSTTTLLQTIDLHAPPDEVYRAYMLGPRHAEFTGGPAEIDGRVGGAMSAWNGYITGEFLHIEEGRRIVQSWRTTEWPEGYDDSKLELTFTPTESGTRVTMVHSNVPSEQARRYDDGWKENYWEPLKKYLSWEQPTS
jgi:uncharacterized protein YndB with AHSA1/START domain